MSNLWVVQDDDSKCINGAACDSKQIFEEQISFSLFYLLSRYSEII